MIRTTLMSLHVAMMPSRGPTSSRQQQTVDELYQAHTAQQVIAGKVQTSAIFSYAKAVAGFTPTGSGDDLYKALSVQTPLMGSTPPPGQYWNYATQKWEPL